MSGRLLPVLVVALTLVAAADASAANRWLRQPALNIAHQGGEDEFPSNTMYAFREALKGGADMLELDIGVTRDGVVVVSHDTTVQGKTNGRGTVSSKTLAQIRKLDAAYWFSRGGPDHYSHSRRRSAYRFRGVAAGRRRPPRGYDASDFRVPTLRAVMRAFPTTPINIEIKGRTKKEADAEYVRNAEVLARLLKPTKRRNLVVASFKQAAVDRFHRLVPRIDVAPGIEGSADYLLAGKSPGPGVAVFQLPITYRLGETKLAVTTRDNVAKAHGDGYAWHNWFSDDDSDSAASWRRMLGYCVDGVMTARPIAFEKVLRASRPPARCRRG